MRKLLALLLITAPLNAQVSQAKFDSVVARVEFLEKFVGTQYVGKSSAELAAALVPSSTLPGGRYPIFLSDYQIRVGLEAFATNSALSALQAQVTGLAQRLSVVESAAAGGQPVGTAVFDKIRANRLCLGDYDCNDDWNAQLQIRGNFDATVGLESNKNGQQSQSPRPHVAQLSLSTDGGPRIAQNMMGTFSRGWVTFVDPCRETLNLGPDSRGNFSIDRGEVDSRANPFTGEFCTPIPVPDAERTQALVITTDALSKKVKFFLWKAGWIAEFVTSSCKTCMDKAYPVPRQ